ncbi:hypothetical protein XELAEV_18014012mg [Xenopus laevis]|uniref:Secreted protein n=1 Tax=Xenopus laevis TaxID=8355 RepID=A0A974I002_XENLA|nr:hypothetical protein XELAEV_18014012mg [Xenopus laevis]
MKSNTLIAIIVYLKMCITLNLNRGCGKVGHMRKEEGDSVTRNPLHLRNQDNACLYSSSSLNSIRVNPCAE